MSNIRKAVFLERDGVLNQLVWNRLKGQYESPDQPEDLILCDNIIEPLKKLRAVDF